MDFNGTFTAKAPASEVYKFILDPHKLGSCIPGFKELSVLSPDEFNVVVRAGVAFIKGDFKINMKVVEKEAPKYAKITGNGQGLGGTLDLEATINLTEDNGNTSMEWKADAKVGGKIASLGQRMIGRQAEKIITELFEGIKKNFE
ncbi:MAG: carbon monoxide dehydrogenase subunit G [Candidatus Thermoplasmatota archaeon]|nr:carbon monoxide dehydrogenase subunit G [Candidatus Thermoplasmatota archaeon]